MTPCQEAGSTDPVVVGGSLVVVLEVVVLVVSGAALVVVEVVVVSGAALVVVGVGSEPPPQPVATSTTASSAGSHVLTATTLRQRARYRRAAFGNQAVMPKRWRPKQSMALPRMSLYVSSSERPAAVQIFVAMSSVCG